MPAYIISRMADVCRQVFFFVFVFLPLPCQTRICTAFAHNVDLDQKPLVWICTVQLIWSARFAIQCVG